MVARWFRDRLENERQEQREKAKENLIRYLVIENEYGSNTSSGWNSDSVDLSWNPDEIVKPMSMEAWNDALERMFKSMKSMDSMGISTADWVSVTKKIQSIQISQEYDTVDVSRLGGHEEVLRGPLRITFIDQDGDEVPEELHSVLEKGVLEGKIKDQGWVDQVLGEWNSRSDEMAFDEAVRSHQSRQGHKSGCSYMNSDVFSCRCQPETIFGVTRLWRCSCCEQPVADTKFGLCDLCEAHQYSDPQLTRVEHEIAINEISA